MSDYITLNDIEFVNIPAGIGVVGKIDNDPCARGNELNHFSHFFKSFYISKYPITQIQYFNIIGENPSYYNRDKCFCLNNFDTNSYPVESISWIDALQFCKRLSSLSGNQQIEFRLPYEIEWEYACRGGNSSIFQEGNEFNSTKGNIQGNYPYETNIIGPTLNRTCEVGQYEPNEFGLYDMHGNVWEWCMDEYKSPSGIIYPNARVLKGGAWNCYSRFCRTSYRCINEANKRYFDTGFRVVISKNK